MRQLSPGTADIIGPALYPAGRGVLGLFHLLKENQEGK